MSLFIWVVFWMILIILAVSCFVYASGSSEFLDGFVAIIIGIVISAFIITSYINYFTTRNERIFCEYENGYNSELCK